ncbi:MAG: alanine--tRNA ligase, partial [Baekduia sp.]
MTSDEIRETFLAYFEARGHRRLRSGSLVPASYDPSVLLTTAGMHPLKPYFQGLERPPHNRLASCQKCFRTPDIENVGVTARHLTFFEMLGNFSLGDYFKAGAAEFAWELSLEGFGFSRDDLWVTVFEGDDELGLGPDEEAIAAWETLGVPRDRIVLCPRSENFWQAGPTGPCGPCSELYLDRGLEWGSEDDLPGGENERFLEYWNLVFMQYDQSEDGVLTPLPSQNIDTGLGLNRMAVIQQGVDTVFDTDQFAGLMALGKSLATVPDPDLRALRVLADHTRGMTFLIADGVVPSNEERGYVLRRLMRRAIAQGHRLGFEPGFLPQYVDVVTGTMGAAYPELTSEREAIVRWVTSEEESFGHTLETGLQMLDGVLARGEVTGEEAFKLHDTYGFPIDLTEEIAAERGVPLDRAGFDTAMDAQRTRSSAGASAGRVGAVQELVRSVAAAETEFTGYASLEEHTTVLGVAEDGGRTVVKLAESPFYAQGGGQVSDSGTVGGAQVVDVLRAGEDQALVLDGPAPAAGDAVDARVDREARTATQANHTATHLLHAALRERLGTHVRQAGSYVGPDKLRFDFTHGQRLTPDELMDVEDRVNGWVLAADPVRPITTTLDEAKALGAMALFGEKYGDVVRMVQLGDGSYSRELCGGTHVRSTAEIGVFAITSEGSSASNVRRIEAV